MTLKQKRDMSEFIKNIKLKLVVIFLFPAVGMLYFSSGYVYEKISKYQNTKYLEKIVEYVKTSSNLISELQRERGLSIAFLSKNSSFFQNKLKKQRLRSDNAFKQFVSLLSNNSYIELYDEKNIKNILDNYSNIGIYRKKIDKKDISIFDVLDFYSKIVTNLIESTDILKAQFINESFFNLIICFHDLLKLTEVSGKERAIISYILEIDNLTPKLSNMLLGLEIEYKELKNRFSKEASIQIIALYNKQINELTKQKYDDIKYKVIYRKNISNIDSTEWWKLATDYINAIYKTNFLVLQQIIDLKKRLKEEAFSVLTISILLWVLTIFALYFLTRIVAKMLNTFGALVQTIDDHKRLYKAFAEFSEILVYNKDEKTILNSLSVMLFKTEKFVYLWLGKVEKDRVEPIISENIPIALIQQDILNEKSESLKFYEDIQRVIKEKYYIISSCENKTNSHYDGVDTVGIFPIMNNDKVVFILVVAFEKSEAFDAGMIDLITKMTNELTFAFEKIANKQNEERLKEELRIAACAFDSHEAIAITDSKGHIVKVNDAFTRITGYKPDEVIGESPNVLKSGIHNKEFYATMWDRIRKYGHWTGEIYNRRKNGEVYPELLSVSTIKNKSGEITHYIAHFFDISEIKKAQEKAEYRAYHDSLTDLYNRQKLIEELEKIYQSAVTKEEYNAFLFFDLDNFKYINDYYNHEIGDKVLIEISKKLCGVLCENDVLARVAGDEFALIACNLGKDKSEATKKVSILIEKIKKLFENPVEIDGHNIEVTFSVGVKIFPDQEKNYKDVMVNADIAMYYAKKSGKNQFHFFNERLDLESKQFLLIKNELTEAIKNRELVLHYQPKVSVKSGEVVGFEALIRWQHPQRGLLYPDQFLYVTIGNRLSFDLSEYVLKEVCLQINRWKERWPEFDKKVSINISGEQFNNKNFTQSMMRIIEEQGINPEYLDFEIVEDALLKDFDRTIEVIKTFKNIGVSFSMDDFGTGYSSINYLKNLPVDILKIDKSFILDLFEGKNVEIVKMIIDTAKVFDLKVVAEGVENEDILKYLNSCGCEYYQGYYFSKPVPVDEATNILLSTFIA